MSRLRKELRTLFELSWPAAVTQVGLMLIGVVDTLMVARVHPDALAASALANMWQWSWMSIGIGAVMGIDPMISQAHGRGDSSGSALALQRGVVVALVISVPVMIVQALTEPALLLIDQPAAASALAQRYNLIKLPSTPCILLFTALRQFLQARGAMAPATRIIYVANIFNLVVSWVLVFGHFGSPALGLDGAALAGTLTAIVLLAGIVYALRVLGAELGARRSWDRESFDLQGILGVLRLGIPIGLQMSLEAWAFTFGSFMAGWLGVTAVGSHQVTLNMAALAFMVPLGVSMGASARIGHLIGAGDREAMRYAARVALVTGAGVMSLSALAFTFLRVELPSLYTDDAALIAQAAQILPIAAAFQLADGTQAVAGGVLRGMGKPEAAAIVNLVGYYVLGLPLAYVLGFRLELGLRGIWIGLAVGLFIVAGSLLIWVRRTARRPLSELSVDVQEFVQT